MSELHVKVRHPDGLLAVKVGVEPVEMAVGVPVAVFASYTVRKSQQASKSTKENVTVTTSPGTSGQMVMVWFSLFR